MKKYPAFLYYAAGGESSLAQIIDPLPVPRIGTNSELTSGQTGLTRSDDQRNSRLASQDEKLTGGFCSFLHFMRLRAAFCKAAVTFYSPTL